MTAAAREHSAGRCGGTKGEAKRWRQKNADRKGEEKENRGKLQYNMRKQGAEA
jgi:hypothetical protein